VKSLRLLRVAAEALRGRVRRYRGRRGIGQAWEELAAGRLERAGYTIVARNFRTKAGEIDLVARDGRTLCFVEVKGRRSLAYGAAAEAVDREKQRRIWNAAQLYLEREHVRPVCRFDVVTIDASGRTPKVEILRAAFEGPPAPPPRR
jgi:putative endonuclease